MVNIQKIDLHTHTNCSDGLLTPKELLKKAKDYGIIALSITDHDILQAYEDKSIFDFAISLGIELVSGVEFSTIDINNNKYHILGLMIDISNQSLISVVEQSQNSRLLYAKKVSELLRSDGWFIEIEGLLNSKESITKAHISRLIIENPKNEKKILEYFKNMPNEGMLIEFLLIKGKKYYIPSEKSLTPKEAIDVIHDAGGVAILAHPTFNIIQGEDLKVLCERFKSLNIDGFEAINIQFDKSNDDKRVDFVKNFSEYAEANNLLITGGSDFHHSNKDLIGNFIDLGFEGDEYMVDISILKKIKEYLREKRENRENGSATFN